MTTVLATVFFSRRGSSMFLLLLAFSVSCTALAQQRNLIANVTTLAPFRSRAIKGRVSNQGISVLALNQQSGTQDDWKTYLELSGSSNARIFKIQFDFEAAAPAIQDSQLQSMAIHMNSIGLDVSQQRRVLKIKRVTDNRWITIGSNRKAPAWSWFRQEIVVNDAADYYRPSNKGPAISLQLLSNNKLDVANVDYLVIDLVFSSSTTTAPAAPSSLAPTSSPTVAATPTVSWWQPKASDQQTFQYQLQGAIDTRVAVDVYDIDLFAAVANGTIINTLHEQGRKVICYFSAGTYEAWNSDWSEYFDFVEADTEYTGTMPPFAKPMADWPGERWLDVSRINLLEPIMTSRLQLAANAGCDAVEPDNMDAYANRQEAGLPNLTAAQQLVYNRRIADIAHSFGLAVGLKNDLGQLAKLVDWYDFAVNEQCFQYNECDTYAGTFLAKDKPVFGVEYSGKPAVFCPKANDMNMSFSLKKLSLKAYRMGCEDY